ncbi:MAG: dihydrolipoamide acetyltransferase family protein [Gemmatimonadota bacterium]
MATKIVMEALSPTMEEGRLVEWKKKEGDAVAVGDVLAEVETDKAVMELVARAAGQLLKQVVAAGATVPVSSLVGWIGAAGEAVGDDGAAAAGQAAGRQGGKAAGETAAAPAAESAPAAEAPPAREAPAAADAATPAQSAKAQPGGGAGAIDGRIKASPLAKKIASDKGIDLAGVAGSGPEGRIIKRDLDKATPTPVPTTAPTPVAATGAAPRAPIRTSGAPFEDVPLTQIRKTIAKRLAQSIGPIPTFYLTAEIDMERAWDAREALKAQAGDAGKVSFNDIVVKAVAAALRQHRACNAWWQDDKIRYWNEVHVGMAVAVEDGLITPVIRNADQKSLREISAESKELAGRARERKLKPEEYTGATFSISNLGMFDIEHFTAVINPPESGILAIGRIAEVPTVVGGQIMPQRRMRVTMSCDHRVIDGATGAAFLRTVKMMLENPLALVW